MTQYPDLELYIGGHWKKAPGQPVINPADESVLGTVPAATESDLANAVAAAADGFKTWSKTSPAKRAEIILKATALMRERANFGGAIGDGRRSANRFATSRAVFLGVTHAGADALDY